MITATKIYTDIPFAHRQPNHAGHCAFIHGHNWTFEFTFGCKQTDACDFVLDFGSLGWLKNWLDDKFDHTLVLNQSDPYLKYFHEVLIGNTAFFRSATPFAKITVVPSCSCEGLCKYLASWISIQLYALYKYSIFLVSVTVRENSKNFATLDLQLP